MHKLSLVVELGFIAVASLVAEQHGLQGTQAQHGGSPKTWDQTHVPYLVYQPELTKMQNEKWNDSQYFDRNQLFSFNMQYGSLHKSKTTSISVYHLYIINGLCYKWTLRMLYLSYSTLNVFIPSNVFFD